MRNSLLTIALALTMTIVSVAEAQRTADSGVVARSPARIADTTDSRWANVQGTRSPLLAGLLNYPITGLGSFYAGHRGHGTRHLLISAALLPFCMDGCNSGRQLRRYVIGAGFAANLAWSAVTAFRDARARNAAIRARQRSQQGDRAAS